jgi:phosphatidate phosphatase PAH1
MKSLEEPELEDDGWGEIDVMAEFERVVEENAKLHDTIEHLEKDAQTRENRAMLARIAGLEARIGQLTKIAREAQKHASTQGKVLHKLRGLFKVERNSELMTRLEATSPASIRRDAETLTLEGGAR